MNKPDHLLFIIVAIQDMQVVNCANDGTHPEVYETYEQARQDLEQWIEQDSGEYYMVMGYDYKKEKDVAFFQLLVEQVQSPVDQVITHCED